MKPRKGPSLTGIILMVGVIGVAFALFSRDTRVDMETISQAVTREFSGHISINCDPVQQAEVTCFLVAMPPLEVAAILEQFPWQKRFGAVQEGTWLEAPEGGYLHFTIGDRQFFIVVTGGTHDASAGVAMALSRE